MKKIIAIFVFSLLLCGCSSVDKAIKKASAAAENIPAAQSEPTTLEMSTISAEQRNEEMSRQLAEESEKQIQQMQAATQERENTVAQNNANNEKMKDAVINGNGDPLKIAESIQSGTPVPEEQNKEQEMINKVNKANEKIYGYTLPK